MTFNNRARNAKATGVAQHERRSNSPESRTSAIFPRCKAEKERENINGVINKRINTYVAWCLAQPADWWVASAWASPSALQQKKDAAGHKVRLLSYGEEIRGRFEGAALRGTFIRTSALHRDERQRDAGEERQPLVKSSRLSTASLQFLRDLRGGVATAAKSQVATRDASIKIPEIKVDHSP